MRDAVQSLKAKVIATDLKLDYKDIAAFYSKAKICYEQVHAEDMEAKKQEILRQQEEKKKEILKQQREWEENNRRAVDGQLLIELSDSSEGSADATVVRVYIRPDKSIYYTVNGGRKYEGTPKITVEKAFSVTLDYQPSKAVYTGATVGGITTGGVHYTQAGYTGSATSSGKGEIRVKAGGTDFELQVATMGEYAIDKFKRDPEFKRVAINGRILCWADSLEAASMLQGFLSATSYQDRANAASAYTDERRLSYDRCKVIAKFLNRVINGQFPVSDEALYGKADELSRAGTSEELKRARDIFNRIADYRDSAERAKEAEKKYEEVLQAEKEKAVLEKEARRKKGKKTAGIVAVVACAVIVLSIVLCTVVIPAIRYNNAVALMNAGEYRDAIHAFLPITDYKDSESLLSRCYISIYGEDVWNTFKDLEVGDTYVFGAYEQDNNLSNGKEDIEWLVLAKDGTRMLVISKCALDLKPYHESEENVTWATCTLRAWLNHDFMDSAFTDDEKMLIPTVTVAPHENSRWFGFSDHETKAGNATQDQVFLLSVTEAERYFSSDDARRYPFTPYVVSAKGGDIKYIASWLRTPGAGQDHVSLLDPDGSVDDYGQYVDREEAVRPAMWIDLDN